MKVLVVSPEVPREPLGGLGLQLTHLLRELQSRHEVTLLGMRSRSRGAATLPGCDVVEVDPPNRSGSVRLMTWLRAGAERAPFAASAVGAPVGRAVADLIAQQRFDVVHVASSILAGIAPAIGRTPAVLAALDAWHLNAGARRRLASPWARPLYALEERRIRRFEARTMSSYRRVVVVTEEDGEALRALDPGLRIEVIPNGVDTEEFTPNDDVRAPDGDLVFSGTMSWAPNVEAAIFLAHEVLPRVRAIRPDAQLSIVGRAPSPRVLTLGDLDAVRVTGEVADMRPSLWGAQVYACPMVSGTGIKNKLLEALACGAPAVATSIACRGMDIHPGQEVLVADDAEGFAAAVLRLLEDEHLRERLGTAGRRYVVERHGWGAVAESYERVYRATVQEARSASPEEAPTGIEPV